MPQNPRIFFEESSMKDRVQEQVAQEKEVDPVLFLKQLKKSTKTVQKKKGPQLRIKL